MGLEGETIITQDLLLYEIQAKTRTAASPAAPATGVGRPRFWERPLISASKGTRRRLSTKQRTNNGSRA